MKTNKVLGMQEAENLSKRLAVVTHTLNALYEKVDNFIPVLEQLYWKGEVHTGQFEDLRAAFKQADKILEGN